MGEDLGWDAISRRRALSLLGLAGGLGLAVPPMLLTVSDAEAQAIPPAFNQVDKPLPGDKIGTGPYQPDKPIPGDKAGTARRPRRKRVVERRQYRRNRSSRPLELQPPASEGKPK